ncbi:amidohydrolase family protein [Streptomyces mirabilis]|uniref:amidohydrolase family protein n=1 Tax=Streptomyces mirabilis TaxID=68239 RepID=UPI0036518D97
MLMLPVARRARDLAILVEVSDVAQGVLAEVDDAIDDADVVVRPAHRSRVGQPLLRTEAASVAAVRPRPVAVHCVTRVQLLVTLLALEEAGPVEGDRIEHGSVIPAETLPWLARLGVTVVTQPHFPVERGREYATDVDPADQAHLYRCRSLAEAGIPLAAGTDAPYGSADPWAVMRAAVERSGGEAVARRAALDLFVGEPQHAYQVRRLAVGSVADLFLLHVPLKEALDLMSADVVRATFVGGRRITPPD